MIVSSIRASGQGCRWKLKSNLLSTSTYREDFFLIYTKAVWCSTVPCVENKKIFYWEEGERQELAYKKLMNLVKKFDSERIHFIKLPP